MSNIDKQAVTAKTKELSSLMVERFSMNPVSCKLLNEAWKKEFPDEVAIAERMLALLDELERNQQYVKRRDQENEDIALTVGKLRVELEAAKKLIAELEAEPVSQTYKLNELSGNSPVTPDGWISCSERMPVIGELNWRTSFPLLITCEIGVIPAYYGFVSVNGDKHYGFMESFKYGDDSGNHPQTNEYGLISNVTHWMPLPEPPQEVK